MINKVVPTFDEAVADMFDGAVVHMGGFGGAAECPSYLIAAVARKGVKELTITGNIGGWGPDHINWLRGAMKGIQNLPEDWHDQGLLVDRGQVRKGVITAPGSSRSRRPLPFARKLMEGAIELEMVPQGVLAQRIRAAKAGIPAYYSPVGPGTVLAEGKETREFNGRTYLLEHALKADYALVRAQKGDRYGNLYYRGTARTFNATMAGAATVTIAEIDELVEPGDIEPEQVMTPSIYVQRVVLRPPGVHPWEEPM